MIVQMYSGDKTTIKLGSMQETVEVTCGIRQGCSISTLLFKLVTFCIIEDLEENDIDAARVPTVERDLDRILEKRDEFRTEVRNFIEDFNDTLDSSAQSTWRDCIKTMNSEVKAHAKRIRAKVHQVCPPLQPLT